MFSLASVFTLALAAFAVAKPNPATAPVSPRVLVFTKTEGFRHDSIPTAIDRLKEVGHEYNILFDFSEDSSVFQDTNLTAYDGVFFISTSENILDNDQQGSFTKWLQSGGVYAGAHLACGTLQNMTAYKAAVGALFDYHPEQQDATFSPVTKDHPATADFPDTWTYSEEVYFFQSDPRDMGATVLVTVDKSKLNNPNDDPSQPDKAGPGPHPIAWYIEQPQYGVVIQGAPKHGRSFFTSLGHSNETWKTDTYIHHVMGGLTWALDGGSTRAYQTGLIGNNTTPPPPPPPKENKTEDDNKDGSSDKKGLNKDSAAGPSRSVAVGTVVLGAVAAGLALVL